MKIDVTHGLVEGSLRVCIKGYGDNNHAFNLTIEDDDVDRMIAMIDGLTKYQMTGVTSIQGAPIPARKAWQTQFAVACGMQLQ